jgi:hypothetical protein
VILYSKSSSFEALKLHHYQEYICVFLKGKEIIKVCGSEENILLEVEDSAEETKQYILKSIQALSEHIITRNYHHIDGKLLYESIMNLIKN